MLLTEQSDNAKLAKTPKGWRTCGLSLAPARLSGHNVCASSTPECRRNCLTFAGYGGIFPSVQKGRIEKTRQLFRNRPKFLSQLSQELGKAQKLADRKGERLAVRLNVFSDILWEKIAPELFSQFERVQFYDYTKHVKRFERFLAGQFPQNYFLTFSRSERNDSDVSRFLEQGAQVAVVFRTLPESYLGYPVHNGDENDLRFLQSSGVVGLIPKGKLRFRESNFVALNTLGKGR